MMIMPRSNLECIQLVWYHPETDTVFMRGHLDAMFFSAMTLGGGHFKGVEFMG